MAHYSFNLKHRKGSKPIPINLIVRYAKNRVVFYTRESIRQKYWNDESQRAVTTKQFPTHPEFNRRLDEIENTAKSIFLYYQNNHDHREPAPAEYKRLLEAEIKGITGGIPRNFIGFAEYYIKLTQKKFDNAGGRNTSSYAQTLNCVKDFAKDKNRRVDFDSMNIEFYNDFVEYLQTIKKVLNDEGEEVNKYGFKANTVGKHIRNLRHILKEATQSEPTVNRFEYYKRFESMKEEVDAIYLDENELTALYKLDLSSTPGLDRVRDSFIIGCWTGLRYSDFSNIQTKNIKGNFLHITTQKTGTNVVIPIDWTVREILMKYGGTPPRALSNVKMNKYLKTIGAMIPALQTEIEIGYTKAGMKLTQRKKKYELLVTHTARRSFATNMYKHGVPIITIMRVTGHKTQENFLKYIKVTPDEHAKIMMKHLEGQRNLKIA